MPIKFEIYRDGERVTNYAPIAAVAMGPESVPMGGEISFEGGLLVLRTEEAHPTGVSLLWDAGEIGSFHLETTRLKPREKPYILNVELARCRLMKILQKQEDWNLFDFPRAEKFITGVREAQAKFAESLGLLHDGPAASKVADEVLAEAIDLSEQLALFHAELLLNRRRASNTLVRHVLGVRVDSSIPNARYKEIAGDSFDYVMLPIPWRQVVPEEGAFETDVIDEWIEALTKKRVPIIAGPLVDLSEGNAPDWLYIWQNDYDAVRELAFEYVHKIVTRYRKHVAAWNVASALHCAGSFAMTFEQIIDLSRLLVSQVKTVVPTARTLVSIAQPFGEYHARPLGGVPPILYAEMMAQAGVNFEAFGVDLEFGFPRQGYFARDLFQLSCLLDKFSSTGKPLFITSMGVPDRLNADPSDRFEGKLSPRDAGRWRSPWDAGTQSRWMDEAYKIALSKPFVESVAWGNLADLNASVPGGGLVDDMFKPKASFAKLAEWRELLHKTKPEKR